MSDAVVMGARAAAKRLAGEFEPGLRGEVELALQARSRTPEQYVDPIALGALIVSAAQFAWQIHMDVKRRREARPATLAQIAAAVREQLDVPPFISREQSDRVVEVVVAETVAAAETPHTDDVGPG